MEDATDIAWIKQQLEQAGLPKKRLAAAMRMDPTTLSKVLNGKRRLQIHEARMARDFFAGLSGQPSHAPGFSEGDVVPWAPAARAAPAAPQPTWRVLHHMPGFLLQEGDVLRVDQAATPVPGDLVLASVPDEAGEGTVTILRRMAPGWYISDNWRSMESALPDSLRGVVRKVTRTVRPDAPAALPPPDPAAD